MEEQHGSFTGTSTTVIHFHLRRYWVYWIIGIIGGLFWLVVGYQLLLAAPKTAPIKELVRINEGESMGEIVESLVGARVISHPTTFTLLARLTRTDRAVQAGLYRFSKPQNLFAVMHRLKVGGTEVEDIRLTFPEGEAVREMGDTLAPVFGESFKTAFVAQAAAYEGFLFPDTYLFAPDATPTQVIETMRKNFDRRVAPLLPDIGASGHTLSEIVTMASLIEKEARTDLNRKIVAGILWHRIEIKMPLQVDAVFGYIAGKDTYSPTYDDLAIDSPYNTYKHAGLPPGPIGNPGLDALSAALYPTASSYLYYLTDKDGVMHYAKTFEEHKENRAAYGE
jgi:UPF0755 protein